MSHVYIYMVKPNYCHDQNSYYYSQSGKVGIPVCDDGNCKYRKYVQEMLSV